MSAAFLAKLWETLGSPSWFLNGTTVAGLDAVPETILVSDYVAIYGNIAQHAADPGFHIEYVKAGVPLFRGPLDQVLRSAPDLRSALGLWEQFGSDLPGCIGYHFEEHGDWSTFWLEPRMELGPARPILAEMALLVIAFLAGRCLGRPVRETRIELAYAPPAYSVRLKEAFPCRFEFNARQNAIGFPSDVCREKSATYDERLWRAAIVECEREVRFREAGAVGLLVMALIEQALTAGQHMPRLREAAMGLGMSERTLIRRLRAESATYQNLLDDALKARAQELLADHRLSISQISDLLGLSDASGIYRRFQRWYGKTPSQIRSEQTQA